MGKKNAERLNIVFSTTVTIQVFLAIIVAFLTETIGLWYLNTHMVIPTERLPAANWVFQLSIATFCLNLVTIPFNAAIIAHERMKTFAYVSILDGTVKLIIAFLVMAPLFDKLIYYAMLLCVLQLSIQTIYRMYCKKNFSECAYHFVVDKPLLKQMFGYAGWHLIGNSATILKNQGVDLILNAFYGPIVNAAKGVSNQVLTAVTGFASNFMMAMNPQITQSYASGNRDYMMKLINKGSRFSFYILLILSIPIIIESDYLLNLWLVEVPDYAVQFVQLSLIVSLITSLSNPLMTAQNATGKVKIYQIIVGGTLLLNLPLCFLFIKMGFSPICVIFVAIAVEIACLFARLAIIPKYINEFHARNYLREVALNCLIVSVLSVCVPFVVYYSLPENFMTFSIVSIISILSSIIVIFYVGCDNDERTMILQKAHAILSKVHKI